MEHGAQWSSSFSLLVNTLKCGLRIREFKLQLARNDVRYTIYPSRRRLRRGGRYRIKMQDIPFESETSNKKVVVPSNNISLGSSLTVIGFAVTIIATAVAVYVYQKNGHFSTASENVTQQSSVRIEPLHPPFPTR